MNTAIRSLALILFFVSSLHGSPVVTPLGTPRQGGLLEFRIDGVSAVANPFDPGLVTVTGTFVAPSGTETGVPAFWFQDYRSTLQNGSEKLSPKGAAEWRLRFTPGEAGEYQLRIVTQTGAGTESTTTNFLCAAGVAPVYVRISTNGAYFQTGTNALPLNGANVCWHGSRGTFDYKDWFPAMRAAGENFARIWMAPWAFGIETEANTLNRYRMDRAWQLDEVFRLARENGIFLLLCLDYHGMFETQPDFWGANDNWKINPYNAANGGPCATPNVFFTSPEARELFRKRVKYLIARYGAETHLLAWEFFNEIDNVYRNLNSADVAQWHDAMGTWLHENDPFHHLVTTSLTSLSDRPEIWNLAAMDFAMYHAYGLAQPAGKLPGIIQGMQTRYKKPVMMGEYGIDFRGFREEDDPYFRGLRQGIWAGLMSGSTGTSMSWWWESLHAKNLYPVYRHVSNFLERTAFGEGEWKPLAFVTSGDPPATVGDLVEGGMPFTATLTLSEQWGLRSAGRLALTDPSAAERAPAILDSFFHGTAHPEFRNPCILSAWIGENGKLVMHLNSVSDGAVVYVRVDGAAKYSKAFPNKDGSWQVNHEYDEDISVNLPAGMHTIEIRNTGVDWFCLDWVRFENVLPSKYANDWTPSPVAAGLQGSGEALVYVVNPAVNFPSNARLADVPPMTSGFIQLTNMAPGKYRAIWMNPKSGAAEGITEAEASQGTMKLPLPDFREDLAARILPEIRIQELKLNSRGEIQLRLNRPAPARSSLEESEDFQQWESARPWPFGMEGMTFPLMASDRRWFRVETEP